MTPMPSQLTYELLTQNTCRWSIRNIAALLEKEASFRLVDVSSPTGTGKADWYLPLNPFGKTPALRHGTNFVVESLLMNEYIEETASGRNLLPESSCRRAWVRAWNGYADNALMPRLTRLVKASDDEARSQVLLELRNELARAETRLFDCSDDGGPYWHGSHLGLVDICWWTFFKTALLTFENLGLADAIEMHARLATWRDTLLGNEVFNVAVKLLDGLAPSEIVEGPSALLRN